MDTNFTNISNVNQLLSLIKPSNGLTLWLTGLSGAGKSTLSEHLKDAIQDKCFVLDGDIIRKGLNSDLKFSREDRKENIRRIAEVSKLFNQAGFIVIVAFISPFSEDRNFAKKIHEIANLKFLEIFVNSSLECCEKRDVKGLYLKARKGEIPQFTGISDPYEIPENPDLVLDSENLSVKDCLTLIFNKIFEFYCPDITKFPKNEKQFITDGMNLIEPMIKNDEQTSNQTDDSITLDEEGLDLLKCFQQGWTPQKLKCFMNEEQLLECLHFKTINDSTLLALPIIYPISQIEKIKIENLKKNSSNSSLKLISPTTKNLVAEITNPNFYLFRKEEVCARLFGTFSANHPKVLKYLTSGEYLLTGDTFVFHEEVVFNDGLDDLRLSPEEIKLLKIKNQSDCLYAFQVRNPLHNGHCMLLKSARTKLIEEGYKNPMLLLHPCGGWTKDDDVPLKARVQQYKALLEDGALNPNETILAIWPSPMFYAGPAEVLFHFSSRQEADVDFMIVGRDPAGVKHPENSKIDLYDPTHGQRLLKIAGANGLLRLQQIPFKPVFYNSSTFEMEFYNELNKDFYLNISGSEMRRIAREGSVLPSNFMNEKGWNILKNYYQK